MYGNEMRWWVYYGMAALAGISCGAECNPPYEPVFPVFTCIQTHADELPLAWIGYENHNNVNVNIDIGPDNRFTSTPNDLQRPPWSQSEHILDPVPKTSVAENVGQPTTFWPGRVDYAFTVTLPNNKANVTWVLTNRIANHPVRTIEVSVEFSTKCTGSEVTSIDAESITDNDCPQCDDGSWDVSCGSNCPNPCNNGVCNRASATCECEIQWSDTTSYLTEPTCGDQCAPGWIGTDCSVVATTNVALDPPVSFYPMLAVYGGGHYVTSDGAEFDWYGIGDVLLYKNTNFELQARQTVCQDGSRIACISAVAAQIFNRVIVFQIPYNSDDFILSIDGVTQNLVITATIDMGNGFTLQNGSSHSYKLENLDTQQALIVRVIGRTLSLTMVMAKATCTGATGMLFNGCNGDPADDFNPILHDLNSVSIHNTFVSIYKIDLIDTLGIIDETQIPTGAGSGLKFANNVGVSTEKLLNTWSDDFITVEFLVWADKNGGTLLTYTTANTFAVVDKTVSCDDSMCPQLQIHYDNTVVNTGMALKIGEWNHIMIVWKKSGYTGTMNFYHMSAGISDPNTPIILSKTSISVSYNAWAPGGILGLGGDTFEGSIDELMVWNKVCSFTLVGVVS